MSTFWSLWKLHAGSSSVNASGKEASSPIKFKTCIKLFQPNVEFC